MLKNKIFFIVLFLAIACNFVVPAVQAQSTQLSPEVQQYLQQLQGSQAGSTQKKAPDFIDLDKTTFSSEDLLLQGYFLLELGQYLGEVGKALKSNAGTSNIGGLFIENAKKIVEHAQQLIESPEILSSGESIVMIGDSLSLFGKSLFLTKTVNSIPEGMGHIGQSISQAAERLQNIGQQAVQSGGRLEISEYQETVRFVKLFYQAFLALRETMNSGIAPQARLKSNKASKNQNTTFQVINFDASGSGDESGTIPVDSGYLWDFGDGNFATGPFVSHTYTEANNYLVKLFVVGPSGFAFDKAEIKIDPVYPVAIITTDLESLIGPNPTTLNVYKNQAVRFSGNNSYDPAGQNSELQFIWDFGDGLKDTSNSPTLEHRFLKPGTYFVSLELRNKNLVDVAHKTITVLPPPPTASFNLRKVGEKTWPASSKDFFSEFLLDPLTLEFNPKDSLGSPLSDNSHALIKSYDWDFGDGKKESQSASAVQAGTLLQHTFAEPGIYVVTLKVTDETGSSQSYSKNLYLSSNNFPLADFTVTSSSSATSYSTQDNLLFDASTARVTQGTIQSYSWEIRNSDNEIELQSSEAKFKHIFKSAGQYIVSLEIKDSLGNLSQKVSQKILIESSKPKANFDFIPDNKIPNQITFDAELSSDPDPYDILSYSWDFDSDGQFEIVNSAETKVTRVLDRLGANHITLTVNDNFGKEDSLTKTIEIQSILIASLRITDASNGVGAAPLSLNLEGRGFYNLSSGTDVNNISSITWDFGDGQMPEIDTALLKGRSIRQHTYTQPGNYQLRIKAVDLQGKIASSSLPVYVGWPGKALAAFSFSPDASQLSHTSTIFSFDGSISKAADGTGRNLDYAWDFGDGSQIVSGPTTSHSFRQAGKYNVTLTVTDQQAQQVVKATQLITIYDQDPIATFSAAPRQGTAPLLVYFDASTARDPDGEITEYLWDFGDSKRSISTNPNINHIYKDPGTYAVTLTVTSNNGSKKQSEATTITVSKP